MRLNSKVIIVTGHCTGIGKAIVRRCIAEGASSNSRTTDSVFFAKMLETNTLAPFRLHL